MLNAPAEIPNRKLPRRATQTAERPQSITKLLIMIIVIVMDDSAFAFDGSPRALRELLSKRSFPTFLFAAQVHLDCLSNVTSCSTPFRLQTKLN